MFKVCFLLCQFLWLNHWYFATKYKHIAKMLGLAERNSPEIYIGIPASASRFKILRSSNLTIEWMTTMWKISSCRTKWTMCLVSFILVLNKSACITFWEELSHHIYFDETFNNIIQFDWNFKLFAHLNFKFDYKVAIVWDVQGFMCFCWCSCWCWLTSQTAATISSMTSFPEK